MDNLFKTSGIRYAGSKRLIIPKIHEIIKDLKVSSVLDGFAGTTRCGQYFKNLGLSVTSNDLSEYSYIFGKTFIKNRRNDLLFKAKIDYLNSIDGEEGFFFKNYSAEDVDGRMLSADGKKKPFLRKTAKRIDAIRKKIDEISDSEGEKAALLCSLIFAADKLENTLGHQVAYLNKFAKRCFNDLILEVPEFINGDKQYRVEKSPAAEVKGHFDLAYFDPPYGTNNKNALTTRVRYKSYYHLWETLIKNDNPEIFGASNRRKDTSDKVAGALSDFESTNSSEVQEAFRQLKNVDAKRFLISYSNKSKLTKDELLECFTKDFSIEVFNEFGHKENVQKGLRESGKYVFDDSENLEYLILLKRK